MGLITRATAPAVACLLPMAAAAYDINAYCGQVAAAVGGSYLIEKTCRDEETKARTELGKMKIPSRIEKYCEGVGDAVGGSYQIKLVCVQQETSARDSMK